MWFIVNESVDAYITVYAEDNKNRRIYQIPREILATNGVFYLFIFFLSHFTLL